MADNLIERLQEIALGKADSLDFIEDTCQQAATALSTRNDEIAALREALAPFVDLAAQRGAWGVISKALDGLAPLTVTVTKSQMLAAHAAFSALKDAQ